MEIKELKEEYDFASNGMENAISRWKEIFKKKIETEKNNSNDYADWLALEKKALECVLLYEKLVRVAEDALLKAISESEMN